MELFYVLFFGCLNFLIYYYLINNLKINKRIIVFIILILIIFSLIQILYLNKFYLTNEDFYNLVFFSFLIIFNHYSFEALILFFIGNKEKLKYAPVEKKRLVFMINIMRHKVIYIMIFAYQISFILNF
ncbi:hypothetical protein [Aquimarina sp. AU58]|uniref:hypothetical protein n=1 Tax=Aquimarina sp. AU58 TaxID=1874112 RepID=UPI000D655F01|nr:hypothetical protein [Aquimarina sp. AU58]